MALDVVFARSAVILHDSEKVVRQNVAVPNEAVTDDLVRDALVDRGFVKPIRLERQQSSVAEVRRLLAKASKSGDGIGYPDFVVTDPDNPSYVVVVESKASPTRHESPGRDRPKDYAVDGVLHYARFLSDAYMVIAIAVSGQDKSELKVSTSLQAKGEIEAVELLNDDKTPVADFLDYSDYLRLAKRDPSAEKARSRTIAEFSRELHDFIYSYVPLTEEQKPLLVAGTLIALRDAAFRASYMKAANPKALKDLWFVAIDNEIQQIDVPVDFGKKEIMRSHYKAIASLPALDTMEEHGEKFDRGIFYEVIRRIDANLSMLIDRDSNQFFDVVGEFYGQFLKYTGGDKRALGIVLTPRHVTELFAKIANLDASKRDIVLDPCAGTGSFLIAAMNELTSQTQDSALQRDIRANCLVGIEQNTQMYTLAASNMILHGDGRSNLYMGSCFDEGIRTAIESKKPRVGFVNPPYAQDKKSGSDKNELVFVKNMLDMLTPGGVGIAIVPMSCAAGTNRFKEAILKDHTLDAVMSMPTELFTPVGVVACIMVFTAHTPHEKSNRMTWFGYWKDDGFAKIKYRGRVDQSGAWPKMRDEWLHNFRNQLEIPGHSVKHRVTSQDEWVAEAYMETDYARISADSFVQRLRDLALFKISERLQEKTQGEYPEFSIEWVSAPPLPPVGQQPDSYRVDELFDIERAPSYDLNALTLDPDGINWVSTSGGNNGVSARVAMPDEGEANPAGTISVALVGNTLSAFLQESPYICTQNMAVLSPKKPMSTLELQWWAHCIRANEYRYNYGRKANTTFASLRLPGAIPEWVARAKYPTVAAHA